VVVAGMLAATLLATFLLPMLFVAVDRLTTRRATVPVPMTPATGETAS
jgi:hypothetical protein